MPPWLRRLSLPNPACLGGGLPVGVAPVMCGGYEGVEGHGDHDECVEVAPVMGGGV
jgi:hypothetical protein